MNNMIINKLPAPTWTWLRVNEHTVAVPDVMEKAVCTVENMPSEVREGKVDFTSICLGDVELGAGEEFRQMSHKAKTGGASYTVPADVKVEEPIRLLFDYNDEKVGRLSRTSIVLGENSELTVIMIFKGKPSFGANDIRIKTAKNAKLSLVEVFQLEEGSNFVDSIGGKYQEKSGLKLIQVRSGDGSMALSCCSELLGYKSYLDIDTGYLVRGEDKLDINYLARHTGKNTDSKINVSGVLRDKADKTFRGTIDFIKGCKDATGDEREDVLLMDEGVHNNTVPLILCAEEDVEGAHGASIGKISDEVITYMESRGIPEADINELMAKSRIDAVIGRIPDDVTKEKLLTDD